MNKDMLEDEVEFPDEIIAFLKVKYPKAHTDQEKAVLKQIEQLTEEKKELKDIISKKREQAKTKSIPLNVVPSEEAKEKAIKLVQDGTLLLSSKLKTIDTDETMSDTNQPCMFSQKNSKSRVNEDSKESDNLKQSASSNSSKISFVSAGFVFSDGQPGKSSADDSQSSLKRPQNTIDPPNSTSKRFRNNQHRIPSDDSSPEDSDTPHSKSVDIDKPQSSSNVLRFCGHNMTEEFVRRIVEKHSSIISLELEQRNDNSTNVIVTLENPDIARVVKEALDSQYLEGRVVNVYFKRGGSDFYRRPFRRRRFRDFGRGRNRFFRNEAFPSMEHDGLPFHLYSASADNDDSNQRKLRWTVSEDNEPNEQTNRLGLGISSSNLKSHTDRSLVPYDDLDPN